MDQYDGDITNYFNGWESRRDGFARDGDATSEIVGEVVSLTGQQATIVSDMVKARGPWLGDISGTWSALEKELNGLALPRQRSANSPADGIEVELLPHDKTPPMMKLIDSVVPYSDLDRRNPADSGLGDSDYRVDRFDVPGDDRRHSVAEFRGSRHD
ncbi:MAG: hypothetical protein R3B96_19005 [Pirellulaceae bacterium]